MRNHVKNFLNDAISLLAAFCLGGGIAAVVLFVVITVSY